MLQLDGLLFYLLLFIFSSHSILHVPYAVLFCKSSQTLKGYLIWHYDNACVLLSWQKLDMLSFLLYSGTYAVSDIIRGQPLPYV